MTAAPVTLLFTDLVDSTALLQRVGAEGGQRILHAHRQLLREALASHGGREVKWLGDGLLTTFGSVAEGVRCAVTMAQRARRPVRASAWGCGSGCTSGRCCRTKRTTSARRWCWRGGCATGRRRGRSS